MEFQEVLKNRYSCKKFSDRPLEAEKLQQILEAGRLAPTAKNNQEQHIYVLQSEEALIKVDKVTPCRYNAPTVLLVAFDRSNTFTYPGGKYDSGVEDATIVATQMVLAAADAGVDSATMSLVRLMDRPHDSGILSLIFPGNLQCIVLCGSIINNQNLNLLPAGKQGFNRFAHVGFRIITWDCNG